MESRVRMALVLGGLPVSAQHEVVVDGRIYRLDLAYPSAQLGVEYDGELHRTQERPTATSWTALSRRSP
jgi:very-short-patch-repair endonuclease